MQNKRKTGADYESLAASFLTQQGFLVLERNFYCKSGEIDLIAKDGEYLVFVEVKFRHGNSCGNPLEAVDKRKQRKISRAAMYYCMKQGYQTDKPCRFDVVGIGPDGITHIKNAFEYMGKE